MKLDRNMNKDGTGKYALIKLRVGRPKPVTLSPTVLINEDAIDYGDTPDTEFFVIRLKDKYAAPALESYALAAAADDPEFSAEVLALSVKAANHPNKKRPD